MLSVDPGLHGCGCGVWIYEQNKWVLAFAFFAPGISGDGPEAWFGAANSIWEKMCQLGVKPTHIICEIMQVYAKGKSRPSDLLELQGVAGCVVGRFPEAKTRVGCRPGTWKGQVPKAVMAARVEKKVKAAGWWGVVEVPRTKVQLNDIMHGVGVGMYYVEKVFPLQRPSQ